MFFFDPFYFIVLAPGFILSLWATARVKSSFRKWGKVPTRMTGAQAARQMLDHAGLHNVEIKRSGGFLSDHYNPATRSLGLSDDVFGRASISAIGVACHEAGHAIQHANLYFPLQLRSTFVPLANIGSSLSWVVLMLGFMLGTMGLIQLGILLFSVSVFVSLVTLPVEFDASKRAKQLVVNYGILSPQEQIGVAKVLNAAALTYVAAAVTSILTLLYFLMRAGLLGGSRD